MIFLEYKDHLFENEMFFKKISVDDKNYYRFLNEYGDGFYFNQSMHIYGQSKTKMFHDMDFRTNQIKELYSKFIVGKIYCFGEDGFGNQYVFYEKGIGMLTIDSGEIEHISDDFEGWLKAIIDDIDYYTGESLIIDWKQQNGELRYDERLTPKTPFVLGGAFEVDNLYKSNFSKIIEFNADIANQISDMPNGTSIELKIE